MGKVFGDDVLATAILDRLLHHAITFNIKGASYRLREKKKQEFILPSCLINVHNGNFISLKWGNFKSLLTNVISAGQAKTGQTLRFLLPPARRVKGGRRPP